MCRTAPPMLYRRTCWSATNTPSSSRNALSFAGSEGVAKGVEGGPERVQGARVSGWQLRADEPQLSRTEHLSTQAGLEEEQEKLKVGGDIHAHPCAARVRPGGCVRFDTPQPVSPQQQHAALLPRLSSESASAAEFEGVERESLTDLLCRATVQRLTARIFERVIERARRRAHVRMPRSRVGALLERLGRGGMKPGVYHGLVLMSADSCGPIAHVLGAAVTTPPVSAPSVSQSYLDAQAWKEEEASSGGSPPPPGGPREEDGEEEATSGGPPLVEYHASQALGAAAFSLPAPPRGSFDACSGLVLMPLDGSACSLQSLCARSHGGSEWTGLVLTPADDDAADLAPGEPREPLVCCFARSGASAGGASGGGASGCDGGDVSQEGSSGRHVACVGSEGLGGSVTTPHFCIWPRLWPRRA